MSVLALGIDKLLMIKNEMIGNYVRLPLSVLNYLCENNIEGPYYFRLSSKSERMVYVGVKDFTCIENCIEIPSWIMELLDGEKVKLNLVRNIEVGSYVDIEPLEECFFEIEDNDKLLESNLSEYCILRENDIIPIRYFDKVLRVRINNIRSVENIYDMDKCELIKEEKRVEMIMIVNIDLKFNYINKFERLKFDFGD
jgi:hypothetical protein